MLTYRIAVLLVIIGGGWWGYTAWLEPVLDPVPAYVFGRATYFFGAWLGWFALHKFSQ